MSGDSSEGGGRTRGRPLASLAVPAGRVVLAVVYLLALAGKVERPDAAYLAVEGTFDNAWVPWSVSLADAVVVALIAGCSVLGVVEPARLFLAAVVHLAVASAALAAVLSSDGPSAQCGCLTLFETGSVAAALWRNAILAAQLVVLLVIVRRSESRVPPDAGPRRLWPPEEASEPVVAHDTSDPGRVAVARDEFDRPSTPPAPSRAEN